MRAVICKQLGPPSELVVEELPTPTAGKGQVRIDVRAAGVNFPDVLIIQGKYQFKPELPFSPGNEAAGVVSEVGEGVEGFAVGDRVVAVMPWGAFAEQLVVDQNTVIAIPEGVDFDAAAALVTAYGTTIYALKDRAHLREGETLAVLGAAGGVGLAAVQLGKKLGAKVIACASSDDKLAVCREHGADETVNYSTEDLKQRLKVLSGGGVDVVYDPVGGKLSEAALRALGWGGRHLVIGFAAGDIPAIPLNLVLLKSCQIVGVFWGAFSMREPKRNRELFDQMLAWVSTGELRPHVSKSYPFEDAALALQDMMDRKVRGKIVLVPGS